MFNVGGMELLVIGLLALVVLGPDKLPGALRQMGQVVGELRRMSKGFEVDLRAALNEAEREAEAAKRAEAGPVPPGAGANPEAGTAPDPGAAAAAAQAELDAMDSDAGSSRANDSTDAADDSTDAQPDA